MTAGKRANGQSGQFLLQMAGEPGSGKSALAQAVGRVTGAVVIDKDILKTAALNAGAEDSLAGQIAYEAFFDLAESLLVQGFSVVLDSPSFYASIPAKGRLIAERWGASYRFLECVCDDAQELEQRLTGRTRLASQPATRLLADRVTASPAEHYLRVDTLQPVERALERVLDYLNDGARQDLRR